MGERSIKTYRDLIVWQKARSLAKQVIAICRDFPDSDEARAIKRQLIRSATSVSANIAEGYGGHSSKSYQNHLVIARRSVNETDYWIFLSGDLGYVKSERCRQLEDSCREIIMILSKIISTLGKKLALLPATLLTIDYRLLTNGGSNVTGDTRHV